MNRNQVKGAAKDVAGKVQRKVGELTGNENQQAKGAAKQMEGKVQKGVGRAGIGRGRQEDALRGVTATLTANERNDNGQD